MINQSDNVLKLNSINRRMFILATAKVILLGGIVSRLFFLQVKENKKYLTLSDKNRIRDKQIFYREHHQKRLCFEWQSCLFSF